MASSYGTSIDHPAVEIERYNSEFDSNHKVLWGWLDDPNSSCFNLALLADIERFDNRLQNNRGYLVTEGLSAPVNYYVLGSRSPHAFSHGGDLAYFHQCILNEDREALLKYAIRCIDIVHRRLQHYGSAHLITLSLLQGHALGGGLELALTSDIIIAEAHVRLGLPETRFNLLPGMGAHSLLSRKVGYRMAEQLMISGALYSAQEFQEMGLVDLVVPTGQGISALNDYLREHHARHNSHAAIFHARQAVWSITREELLTIVRSWVDAALRLSVKDLCLLSRIVSRQGHLQRGIAS